MTFLNDLPPIRPANLIEMHVDMHPLNALPKCLWQRQSREKSDEVALKAFWKKLSQSPHLLPDLSDLLGESWFARVGTGWAGEGIALYIEVKIPFQDAFYPHFYRGDALELFVDTRDLKSTKIVHRFCHHFLFLPKPVDGVQAIEMTRFRGEDTHPIAEPDTFFFEVVFSKSAYSMCIFVPEHLLYGYDPVEFNRLGLSYILHRRGGVPQHFGMSSEDFYVARHPALWPSFSLIRSSI